MAFTILLDEVLDKAKEFYDSYCGLSAKYGFSDGLTLSQITQEYLDEFKEIQERFQNYLRTLSTDEIEKIEVIMYCGREGFEFYGDLTQLRKKLKKNKHIGYEALQNVESKMRALYLYLGNAIKEANKLNIDLGTDF